MAYQRPMVTVDQNMTITPTSIERDQPAFVFGPNYELHRYSDDSEKAGTQAEKAYAGAQIEFGYPNVIDGEAVDKGYTKLFGDNVVVQLADLTPEGAVASLPEENVEKALRDINGGYTQLLFPGKIFVNRDTDGNPVTRDASLPRNLSVGDLLVVSYKETGTGAPTEMIRTKVVSVKYYASQFNLDSDSSFEGVAGTLVTVEDALPETVNLTSVKVALADVFNGVEFTRKNEAKFAAGVTDPGYQWEQPVANDGSAILVDDDGNKFYGIRVNELNVEVKSFFEEPEYCKVLFADLFVTYRELVTSYADTLHSLVGSTEVANVLGKVHPDNPLAMGVYMAALNSTTDDGTEAPPIYFMAVPSDDEAGYDAVLNRASLTDRVYIMAPTTRDEAILEKVRSHCLDMSAKTVKQWRIATVSTEVPSTVDRLNAKMDPQGDDFLAIPVSDAGIATGLAKYNKFRVVKSLDNPNGSSDTAFRSTLVVGDTVRFNFRPNAWGEESCDTYTVTKIVNNYTVEVKGSIDVSELTPLADNYKPSRIEVFHTFTAAESAEEIAKVSKALASRRMYNIFPSVFGMDGVTMTGEFAACAVAGLISATEPQQPITNVTVRGVDDIPMVYQTFNKTQLDLIASGGTFIIAQDLPNDLVYVRHQISTAYPDGNLNTAELSITKNVDNISYAFAETFRPYYGKYNITPDLIATLSNLASTLISDFAGGSSLYGPQLIAENTEILYVRQNELMKDHVDIAIRLGVPYPCNNIDIVLTV